MRGTVGIACALAVLTAATFHEVLGLPFIGFDDVEYVTANPHVLRGLSTEGLAWALTTGHASNWHPLTWASHMLDATLFGPGPVGPHAVNVALHCANVVLLFLLLARATGSRWRSAFAAALFAVHPLRVESVAWVSERKDVLSVLLWLATSLAYVGWVRVRGPGRYALVAALLTLGLAAKPMLVTLPFALLLLDAWPLGRVELARPSTSAVWRLVREKLPLFVLAAATAVVTVAVQHGAMRPLEDKALPERAANAIVAIPRYAAHWVWPSGLAVFYPYPEPPPSLVVAAAALAIATVSVAAVQLRVRAPFVLVGWSWFLGTLVPVLGLVQVGNQAMADRYTYVPSIGLAIVAAWLLPSAAAWRRASAVGAAAVLLALAAATARQIGFWTSERRLFEHALEVTNRNWLAEIVIGTDLERRGDVAGAIARYRRAVALNPRAPQALNNLGNALVGGGHPAEGIDYLREAVRLWPGYVTALSNLGAALCEVGDLGQAIPYLEAALARAPDYVPARYNLALAFLRTGRTGDALAHFEAVVRLAPDDAEAQGYVRRLRALRSSRP